MRHENNLVVNQIVPLCEEQRSTGGHIGQWEKDAPSISGSSADAKKHFKIISNQGRSQGGMEGGIRTNS